MSCVSSLMQGLAHNLEGGWVRRGGGVGEGARATDMSGVSSLAQRLAGSLGRMGGGGDVKLQVGG